MIRKKMVGFRVYGSRAATPTAAPGAGDAHGGAGRTTQNVGLSPRTSRKSGLSPRTSRNFGLSPRTSRNFSAALKADPRTRANSGASPRTGIAKFRLLSENYILFSDVPEN